MTARAVVILVALLAVAACQLPGSRSGCDNVAIDWVNFIEVGSTQYISGTVPTADLQEADLGPVYAHVKFKLSGNVCDASYRPKDGDAAFLEPGTPVYQVKGQPPAEQLAARFNGHILVYLAIMKGPPPVVGATPST
jgi:hypothetical protein